MPRLRSVLVLLFALALSVSFAIPAQDVPETDYDESESVPYESTPMFTIAGPEIASVGTGLLGRRQLQLRGLEAKRVIEDWERIADGMGRADPTVKKLRGRLLAANAGMATSRRTARPSTRRGL